MDTGLQKAIKVAGSAANLARMLGISQTAVCQWKGVPPVKRCPDIEKLTGVSRRILRPDFFKVVR